MTETPYNPLDLIHLSESVVRALFEREPVQINQIQPFLGAGIYAIYYTGDHPAYQRLVQANLADPFSVPIYVGKAVPQGARIGVDVATTQRTRALFSRLTDHAGSISAASNLNVEDFYARWLLVDSVWIPLGENMLINRYRPVWNDPLAGFGNHDPGAGRRAGAVSRWDALHRGRAWAELLTGVRPLEADMHGLVTGRIDQFFDEREQ